ncbi:MAG: D-alanyl-D-alanine carboxypeptidase [Peptococcaceae bacterium]|nr:D-alanyl-D-alanine carboxypeptidase [Peptococcaceae bacterium]
MKKKISIVVSIICCLFVFSAQGIAKPEVSAKNAILVDIRNGQVLYEKAAKEIIYPASTTKILTALIAVKKGNLNDKVVVSRNAVLVDGSAVGLQENEIISLEDLLYAAMLSSANDAAMAIAEHLAGSQQGFADLMNEEAHSLGAVHSNFVSPHGLHSPEHYTTAEDMAIIAREAMKNKNFRRLVGTYSYHISRNLPKEVKGIPQEDYVNYNKLISPYSMFSYSGANGIKTGYTDVAGSCLVSSVQREGREYLAVIMNTDRSGIFTDSATLFDFAFNEFAQLQLAEKDSEQGSVKVKKGVVGLVGAVVAEDYYYNFPKNGIKPSQESKILLEEEIEAPIKKGQKIGEMAFYIEGKEVGRINLLSDRSVDRTPFFSLWKGTAMIIALLVLKSIIAGYKRKQYYNQRKRRIYQENLYKNKYI